jgi:hypothetical protein
MNGRLGLGNAQEVDLLLRARFLERMKDEFALSFGSPDAPIPLVLKTLLNLVTALKNFASTPPGVGVPSGAWPEGLEWMSLPKSLSRPPASLPTSPSPSPKFSPGPPGKDPHGCPGLLPGSAGLQKPFLSIRRIGCPDNEHRTRRFVKDFLHHVALEQPVDPRPAMGRHGDQVGLLGSGELEDDPGRIPLFHQRERLHSLIF